MRQRIDKVVKIRQIFEIWFGRNLLKKFRTSKTKNVTNNSLTDDSVQNLGDAEF